MADVDISPATTWTTQQKLTSTALNAEFSNIYSNHVSKSTAQSITARKTFTAGIILDELVTTAAAAAGDVALTQFRWDPASGTATDADGFYISFMADDDGGNETEYARMHIELDDTGATSEDASIVFSAIANASLTTVMTLGGTGVTHALASQFNSTITVGVDDTGYDVKFFGATSGAYWLYDESADTQIVRGAAGAAGTLNLQTAETTVVDGDVLGRIDFQAPSEASGTDAVLVAASIWAEADDTFAADNNDADLVFAVAESETAAERARLSWDGTAASWAIVGTTTMTLSDGSITDSSGALSFGNENLSTTGTLAAGATTVTGALTMATAGTTSLDLNANRLILDADQDTHIEADTDDQIDIAVGGQDPAVQITGGSAASTRAIINAPSGKQSTLVFQENGTDTHFLERISATSLAIWSTDIDGVGTDGYVVTLADGTNDVKFAGGISTDGQSAPTSGITGTGDVSFSRSDAGNIVEAFFENSNSATNASNIRLRLRTNQANSDPFLSLDVGAASRWYVGVDNSASDIFTIGYNGSGDYGPSNGGQMLTIDTSGAIRNPVDAQGFYTGAGNDGRFYHDGTNTIITTTTGLLNTPVGIAIGTAATANLIDDASNGAGSTTLYIGNQSITTSSDVRVKRNVRDFVGRALDLLAQAHIVTFEYDPEAINDLSEHGPASRGEYVGMLAHETHTWAPWSINAGDGRRDGDHIWKAEYQHLVPLLIRAVQEQQEELESLRETVNSYRVN